jgi:UDP-N-acetylmuramate dehydrogenase
MRVTFPPTCKVLSQSPLASWCTLRIGGAARELVIPANVDQLVACIKSCLDGDEPLRVIGRGSNLLCSDDGYDGVVIATHSCRALLIQGTKVAADCGVPLQAFIHELAKNGLGGIEYLMSVPGNIGGAIVTNAGRGRHHNKNIDQFVREVTVFDGNRVFTLSRDECRFSHRFSVFQQRTDWTVLSAVFEFPAQDMLVGQQRIRARIDEVQDIQDRSHPNAGTVFKHEYQLDLRGYRNGGARFSPISANWIVNDRHATCADVLGLLEFAVRQHAVRGLPAPVLEWQLLGAAFPPADLLPNVATATGPEASV